ncbi:MAG: hypothetical protein HDT28_09600 [Clostridiales bacterium]|nr:hypothetical protein [Clostridiales bacterium]
MSFEENRNIEIKNSIAADKIIETKFQKIVNKALSIGYVMYVPRFHGDTGYYGSSNTFDYNFRLSSSRDSHNIPYFQFKGYFSRGHNQFYNIDEEIIDENDLQLKGYKHYTISESYDGYNYHNETGTYVSGYTGTISSNGKVDIQEKKSTYTYGVATEARKTNTLEFYLRVIPREDFQEVMQMENSIDWTRYNELQNNEPTTPPKKSDAIKRNAFAQISHLLVFFSILFSSSASTKPIPTVDATVLNSFKTFKTLMATIPIYIVPILFAAGFICAIATYIIQKTKLKPLKELGVAYIPLLYIISATALFAIPLILSYALPSTFNVEKSNWIIYYYMLGITRFGWLILEAIFIVISIVRLISNSHYKKAEEIISTRAQYLDSGKYNRDQKSIQKIQRTCIKIDY